ncbi:MAG: alkaline phosphatase family protein [Acidobacteriaceae bacterium]|nr:alkaline phosphatase family protein [Acidobacteriaceae bacterium]MBV9778857.1 alkaline phosphatase family protein [Acidobacteriaceae bacterium]
MSRVFALFCIIFSFGARPAISQSQATPIAPTPARRIVILKIDGLNADLLYGTMRSRDPVTGKSLLPWFSHLFAENGVVFENFYTRGISLSAPSWSMLDTGRHSIIRGNVEYDRFTGHVYDYLNFFPFYIGYARSRHVDMPGVEVLDRAGIPLLSDRFEYDQRFQGFQLYQRGVRWHTLEHVLEHRFSSKVLVSMLESAGAPSLDQLLAEETEGELKKSLRNPEILYLDFFTGDMDHEGHATNDPAALLHALRQLDALVGRIWTAIEESSTARETLFVAVSDHGMNNVPSIFSESFSLPDFLNRQQGGAHHVITNRHQLSEFKLMGLNPMVQRVTNPSTASFYLKGEAAHYPTAWLDLDGNERASVHLRNSDLNKIHILLLELARPDLQKTIRRAAAACLRETIDRHRAAWSETAAELDQEMTALKKVIEERKKAVLNLPKKWTAEQLARGEDKAARRLADELDDWQQEQTEYSGYALRLRALLALQDDPEHPFRQRVSDYIPEHSLGENNSVAQIEHYVVGPGVEGFVLDTDGRVDEEKSFRYVNYFSVLADQRVRNNPQPALSARPIDFSAMRVPDDRYDPAIDSPVHAYWLYASEDAQLLILQDDGGRIAVKPIQRLVQGADGKVHWSPQEWRRGLPLHLFEDAQLHVPENPDRAAWLSEWHTERDWLGAVHMSQYSNGVIGITEQFSPFPPDIPGPQGIDPILLRYERRRRELVQPDFEVFAADHWNFNVRNFNPGGNHGGFFRISTHSVWMMSGAGLQARTISEPCDSLSFASTLLSLAGRVPSMPSAR